MTTDNKSRATFFSVLGARLVALCLIAAAAFATTGDQNAIADNASLQPDNNQFNIHARDIFDLPGLIADSANDNNGDAFANFYINAQRRLFSAIEEDYLEDAIIRALKKNYSDIKTAEIDIQTPLGGRKAQLGVNIIAAVREGQDSAIGWQMRAYGGEDSTKGANAGVFYRRIHNNVLFGGNVFLDFEDHDYGDFFRTSIGGEVQNRHFQFAANYYLPLTDDKYIGDVVRFSREGFDANFRINIADHFIPGIKKLNTRADYYHYESKHGLDSDNGFRYGVEIHPLAGLRLGVLYDLGEGGIGGEIAYRFNIGGAPARVSDDTFVPDLFAPVLREYSQRIVQASIGVNLRIATAETNNQLYTTAENSNTAAIAIIDIPAGYYNGIAEVLISSSMPTLFLVSQLQARGGLITISFMPNAPDLTNILTVFIRGTIGTSLAMTSFALTVSSYARFAASFDGNTANLFLTGIVDNRVGDITASGGVPPYRYSASGEGVRVNSTSGLVEFDSRGGERSVTATITIDDSTDQTAPIRIPLMLRAVGVVAINPNIIVGVELPIATVALANAAIVGSLPTAPGFIRIEGGTIIIFSIGMAQTITQEITITSAQGGATLSLIVPLVVRAVDAPPINAFLVGGNQGTVVITGEFNHNIATLSASGGYLAAGGDYSYVLSEAGRAYRIHPSRIPRLLQIWQNTPAEVTATVAIDDNNELTAPATLIFSVTAVAGLAANIAGARVFVLSAEGTVGAIMASGGRPPYTYQSSHGEVRVDSNGMVIMAAQNRQTSITAILTVEDTGFDLTPPVALTIVVMALSSFASRSSPILVGVETAVATVILPGGAVDGTLPSAFRVDSGTIIFFSAAMAGATTQPIVVTGTGTEFTVDLQINAELPPPIIGSFAIGSQGTAVLIDNTSRYTIAVLSAIGGYLTVGGDYSYALMDHGADGFRIAGNTLDIFPTNRRTAIATIEFDDDNEHTMPHTLFFRVTSARTVGANIPGAVYTFPLSVDGTVGGIVPFGGIPPYTYQSPNSEVSESGGTIFYAAQNSAITTMAEIIVNDDIDLTPPYTLEITVMAIDGFVPGNSQRYTLGVTATLGSIVMGGGALDGPPAGLSQMGDYILFRATTEGSHFVLLTITAAGNSMVDISVSVEGFQPPSVFFNINSGSTATAFLNDDTDRRFLHITIGGGSSPPVAIGANFASDGSYIRGIGAGFGQRAYLFRSDITQVTAGTIEIFDTRNPFVSTLFVFLTVTAVPPIVGMFDPAYRDGFFREAMNVSFGTMTISGGDGDYDEDINNSGGAPNIFFGRRVQSGKTVYALTYNDVGNRSRIGEVGRIVINDEGPNSAITPPFTLLVTLNIYAPINDVRDPGGLDQRIGMNEQQWGRPQAAGGVGSYSYSVLGNPQPGLRFDANENIHFDYQTVGPRMITIIANAPAAHRHSELIPAVTAILTLDVMDELPHEG